MQLDLDLIKDWTQAKFGSNRDRKKLKQVAQSLLMRANQIPVNERAYFHALLAAYILRNEKIEYVQSKYERYSADACFSRLVVDFDLTPIRVDGRQGQRGDGQRKGSRIFLNEFDAFAPLFFRDSLSERICADVVIEDMRFTCLKVVYKATAPVRHDVLGESWMGNMANRMRIRSFALESNK